MAGFTDAGVLHPFLPGVLLLNGTANQTLRLMGIQLSSEAEMTHSGEELRMISPRVSEAGRSTRMNRSFYRMYFCLRRLLLRKSWYPGLKWYFWTPAWS